MESVKTIGPVVSLDSFDWIPFFHFKHQMCAKHLCNHDSTFINVCSQTLPPENDVLTLFLLLFSQYLKKNLFIPVWFPGFLSFYSKKWVNIFKSLSEILKSKKWKFISIIKNSGYVDRSRDLRASEMWCYSN